MISGRVPLFYSLPLRSALGLRAFGLGRQPFILRATGPLTSAPSGRWPRRPENGRLRPGALGSTILPARRACSSPCFCRAFRAFAFAPWAAGLADRKMVGFAQEPSAPPFCRAPTCCHRCFACGTGTSARYAPSGLSLPRRFACGPLPLTKPRAATPSEVPVPSGFAAGPAYRSALCLAACRHRFYRQLFRLSPCRQMPFSRHRRRPAIIGGGYTLDVVLIHHYSKPCSRKS